MERVGVLIFIGLFSACWFCSSKNILRSRVLCLFFCIETFCAPVASFAQKESISERMKSKAAISIVLNNDEIEKFSSKPGLNFLLGELSTYMEHLGVRCGVNWSFENQTPCELYDYLVVSASVHERLRWDGVWVYDFSNIKLVFVSACHDEAKDAVYKIDSLTSKTTHGSLVHLLERMEQQM